MVAGKIIQADFVEGIKLIFPGVPDCFAVADNWSTIRKVSSHFVGCTNLLASSIYSCVINITLV